MKPLASSKRPLSLIGALICSLILLAACAIEGGVPPATPVTVAPTLGPAPTDAAVAAAQAARDDTWVIGLLDQPRDLYPYARDPTAQRMAAPDRPASLLVRRTNLSTLSFDLYQLDETTTVRTLGFKESDWSAFQPERYGQRLLRSWRVALADQLNTPAEDRLPLAADGGGLPAGAYYLRLSTLEGPRADLLLLVARTRRSNPMPR